MLYRHRYNLQAVGTRQHRALPLENLELERLQSLSWVHGILRHLRHQAHATCDGHKTTLTFRQPFGVISPTPFVRSYSVHITIWRALELKPWRAGFFRGEKSGWLAYKNSGTYFSPEKDEPPDCAAESQNSLNHSREPDEKNFINSVAWIIKMMVFNISMKRVPRQSCLSVVQFDYLLAFRCEYSLRISLYLFVIIIWMNKASGSPQSMERWCLDRPRILS